MSKQEWFQKNPIDYTNCSCKYLCWDCQKYKPIAVITLNDKKDERTRHKK